MHPLSSKERKTLIKTISNLVANAEDLLPRKGIFHRYKFNKRDSLIVENRKSVLLVEINEKTLPSLRIAKSLNLILPRITVDLGAIKFVTNGADIMRPGITEIEESVLEGDIVLIVEERKKSPLAFGIALYDAVDMREMASGKCIKNLHWLRDKWFDFVP